MRQIALLALLLISIPAPAAVVSFLNATGSEIAFTVEHKDADAIPVKLPAGTTTAVQVGREPVLRVTLNGKPAAFNLDPYTPYLFTVGEKGVVSFSGVELAGDLPKPTDVPATPTERKPLELPVTLFVDSASPLLKTEREKQARETFTAAAKVLEAQAGVKFTVAGVEEWESAKGSKSLADAAADFEGKAKVKSGRVLGFVSRVVPGEGFGVGISATHALVRAGSPKSDAERVEVVAQQFGVWIGAARSPDGGSLMRVKLGDGKATQKGWVTQFDPLNLIAVNIWAEELAAGRRANPDDFGPKARQRLKAIYKTVAAIHVATKSEDTHARDLAFAFTGDPNPIPEPKADPVPVVVEVNRTDDEKAVRAVVAAVAKRAKEIADTPPDGIHPKPKGDDLTVEYVKAAAAAAGTLDEKRRARAFLIGLGIALDDSTILRDKPVVKKLVVAVESEDERDARLKVLGRPTVHGLRDWCQHWAVSMALAEMFGEAAAELAGLAKELADMKGTSGFSFTDLAADYAGIDLAAAVNADPKRLEALAKGFAVADYIPDPKTFDDGLSEAAFKKKYGGADDERFKKMVDEVKAAVAGVPAYKKK